MTQVDRERDYRCIIYSRSGQHASWYIKDVIIWCGVCLRSVNEFEAINCRGVSLQYWSVCNTRLHVCMQHAPHVAAA